MPADLVTGALGEQDVAGPARGRTECVQHADRVDGARPRLGEQHDPDRSESRPQHAVPALAVRDRDAERTEEFQRACGAQGNPGNRRHEQQRDGRGDQARAPRTPGTWPR